ncbi:MAG: hypothetical protein IJF33_04170, partial [Clostridia bacterium]|nr:hypothetical protein [Clostridia bacterium]
AFAECIGIRKNIISCNKKAQTVWNELCFFIQDNLSVFCFCWASGSIVLRTSHLLIGALAVVLLVIGGIFLGMWISMSQIDHEIDPNAKDYGDLYVGPAEVTPGNLSAPGYDKVTFRAGERNVQIVLPNPEVNPCYFRFSLVLPDTNETLYRSGLVPPGKAITDVTLSRPLEKGTYRLEIVIEAASLEDRSAMNGLTMEVVLTVQ